MSRRDTDGTDEELGSALDYYGDKLVQLALRVVIAGRDSDQPKLLHSFIWQH